MKPFELVRRASRAFLPACALSLAAVGCASSATPCANTAITSQPDAARERREETFRLDYAITRTDRAETVLVAGKSDVDISHPSMIEESAHDSRQSLSIHVDPRADGRLAVAIEWREVSGEGKSVSWKPSLALAPDVAGVVSLDLGDGDGRRLVVTARPVTSKTATSAVDSSDAPVELSSTR